MLGRRADPQNRPLIPVGSKERPGPAPAGQRRANRAEMQGAAGVTHVTRQHLQRTATLLVLAIALTGCAAERPTHTAPSPTSTAAAEDSRQLEAGPFRYDFASTDWTRTAAVAAHNPHGPAIPAGYGYVLLPVTITNITDHDATTGQYVVTLSAGQWHVASSDIDRYSVRMPDELRPAALTAGAAVSGNLGFWMPLSAEADSTCHLAISIATSSGLTETDLPCR